MPEEDETDEREKLIANERRKLSATFANGVAIALIAVGAIAPALAPKPAFPPSNDALLLQGLIGLICLFGGLTLHIGARMILRGLR